MSKNSFKFSPGFTLMSKALKGTSGGFTLIELMVVVSIIAILSAAGLVSYSTVLKNTRNARRQTDLSVVQGALENYYSDQKYYPPSFTFPATSLTYISGQTTKTYLNQIPDDPNSSQHYTYEPQPSGCDNTSTLKLCLKYCLYADGESIPSMTVIGCTSVHTIKMTSP